MLFVNSATFLISALCLMPIRFLPSHAVSSEQATSVWQELQVGFRFIFGQQSMVLTLVDYFIVLQSRRERLVFILPVYAKGVSPGRPGTVGLVVVRPGVGHAGGLGLAGAGSKRVISRALTHRRERDDDRRPGGMQFESVWKRR